MTTTTSHPFWPQETLEAIVVADDLHVSPFREDGVTYGTPTWIWSVAIGRDLYVRAYNGTRSRWFAAAMRSGAGRISADGQQYEVHFDLAEPSVHHLVDAAYEAKYHGSPYLPPMLQAGPVSATVRISPAAEH